MSTVDGRRHVARWLVALTTLTLAATACSGGTDTATAADDPADTTEDTKTLASLVIIDRDTSVRPVGTTTYRSGNEGENLGIGDTIQTSATGFAEIAYFDGSLTRIDRSGEYTLTALADTGGTRQVKGSLVGGRAWNRVTKATNSTDQFEIDTPVAAATVRGTAFAIDCTTIDVCVFTIVEGTVEITPTGATPVLVTAPAQLTVRRNTTPTAPTPLDTTTLNADPWITKNTTRDTATGKTPPTTTTSTTTSTTTTTTTEPAPTTTAPTTTAKTPATTLAPAPTPTDQPPPPPTTAGLTLDLNGNWTQTTEGYRIVQATGCATGATIVLRDDLGQVVSPDKTCGLGGVLGFFPNVSRSVTFTCTGATCTTGSQTYVRASATSITTAPVEDCLGSIAGAGSAQLSADGGRLTVLQSLGLCQPSFTYQMAWTIVFTRA